MTSEFPNISSFTSHGLTVSLMGSSSNSSLSNPTYLTVGTLSASQRLIFGNFYKWWFKEGLKLIEESYGLDFTSDSAAITNAEFWFYNEDSSTLAYVRSTDPLQIAVNMKFYNSVSTSDENQDGISSSTSAYLDRTLAHELTHGVMMSNIENFGYLPQFITEGMAELTHGIDDERGSRIFELAGGSASADSRLDTALAITSGTGDNDCYAGGFMFLRYLAKQAAAQTSSGLPAIGDITATVNLTANGTYKIVGNSKTETASTTTGNYTIGSSSNGTYSVTNGNIKQIIRIGSTGWGVDSLSGDVTVIGGTGSDTINGISGAYQVNSGAGNDVINVKGGYQASIEAGAGNDTLNITGTYNIEDSTISGGNGSNTFNIDNYLYYTTIKGGSDNDTFNIKPNRYGWQGGFIDAGDGKNSVVASASADSIFAAHIKTGSGDDYIKLSGTETSIEAGEGNNIIDTSSNGSAYMLITSGAGADSIIHASFNSTIKSGAGNDTIQDYYGNLSGNYIDAGNGADYIIALYNNNTLIGGEGNDTLYFDSSSTNNIIEYSKGDGNDLIYNYNSNNTLHIKHGTLTQSSISGSNVVLTISGGTVTLVGANGKNIKVTDSDGNTTTKIYSTETLGVEPNDTQIANTNNDTEISGSGGDDSISNSGSNVTITTGSGFDSITNTGTGTKISTGGGKDTINNGSNGKQSTIWGGADDDYIQNSADEVTIIGGLGNDTIVNTGSNVEINYSSGDGNDVIDGLDTNTTLNISGTTVSTYSISGNDVILKVGSNTITIKNGKDRTLKIKDDNGFTPKVYDGSSNTSGGSGGGNGGGSGSNPGQYFKGITSKKETLTGTDGDDTLEGGKGPDTLIGGKGADLFIYNNGDGKDVINDYSYVEGDIIKFTAAPKKVTAKGNDIIFTVGKGTVTVKDSKTSKITVMDSAGNTTSRIYANSEVIVGESDGNTISTAIDAAVRSISAATRTTAAELIGNAKANTITGSAGNDTLTGGSGKDVFVYGVGNDIITDYTAQDTILLSNKTLSSAVLSGQSATLTMNNNSTLTVNGAANKKGKPVKINISDGANTFGLYAGSASNTIQGTAKADTIKGTTGNDILKGGKGNDLFVFSAGCDTIGDYSVTAKNSDTITLTGGLTYYKHYITGKKNKDVLITFTGVSSETTSLTIANGKGKVATINGTAIELDDPQNKVFAKNDSTASYTATADNVTINASAKKTSINITGNNSGNVIKGSTAADTITGGTGNDTITSGKGKDIIVYTGGNDIITDYTAGQDTIQANVTSASVSGKNLVLTTASGTITLNKAAKKKITISTDGNTSTTQTYGIDSIKVADADGAIISATSAVNSGLKTIDASSRKTAVTIIGNTNDNTIKGGKGNDTLTGGSGNNSFFYANGGGNDVITDYKATDTIVLSNAKTKITDGAKSGTDYKLTIGIGSITIQNIGDTIISVKDSKGTVTKYNDPTATTSTTGTTAIAFIEAAYTELFDDSNFETNVLSQIVDTNNQIGDDYNFYKEKEYNNVKHLTMITSNKSK